MFLTIEIHIVTYLGFRSTAFATENEVGNLKLPNTMLCKPGLGPIKLKPNHIP